MIIRVQRLSLLLEDLLDERAQILMELPGSIAVPEDEEAVVALVEVLLDPSVHHVEVAVGSLSGAIDVDERQLGLSEEGDFEELVEALHDEGVAVGLPCPFEEEGGQMMLETELAVVALEEVEERTVDSEA